MWQPKHDARSKDSAPAPDDQSQRQSLSVSLNSVKTMERLERPSHPFPPGRISPTKYPPRESLGPQKRETSMNCFTGGSSPPPVLETQFRKGTSTESVFFKGVYAERGRFLGNGGWDGTCLTEEQPMSRLSVGGRPNVGSVWQIPEKKKSQSPPPPLPPLRTDSFTATKVFPFSDGPQKTHRQSVEHLAESNLRNHKDKAVDLRQSFKPLPTKDLLHPGSMADLNHNQLHPNKHFSLSSNDVRQYGPQPVHQRQYSDESPLYLNTKPVPNTKSQSVGSYYRSLQDLPTNSRKQLRNTAVNADNERYGKYYRGTSEYKQPKTDKSHWINTNDLGMSLRFKANMKAKYGLPQSQTPHGEEQNGHFENQEETTKLKGQSNEIKRHHEQKRQQDPWVPQEDHRISAQKTPLLHSLAQENRTVVSQESSESASSGKICRRSDRYATTLRNEIQQKRAQLQKSRSAATLTCEVEEEEGEDSKSTETSDTYKDHLKEAQARVLQATSFQRRDLEPLGPETAVVKPNGRIRGRKRFPLAKRTHSFSEPDKIDKVGVEGEHQTGSFVEQRKFPEAKPAFSKPKSKQSHVTNLNTGSNESEQQNLEEENEKRSPGQEQVLSEQQRLGTFAEYQATWCKQKKSTENKTQGRYHSAENILDIEAEEKTVCVHERSRSSPSADFYTTNNPSPWRDLPVQQSTYTRGAAPDHSPQPSQSLPRNDGPVQTDHNPGPNPAAPASSLLAPETTSSPQKSSDNRTTSQPEPGGPNEELTLPVPCQSKTRCPSPQFVPIKLTDKPPPVSNDSSLRTGSESSAMNVNLVRRVPARIIHSEGSFGHSHQTSAPFLSSSEHPVLSPTSAFTRPTHLSHISSQDAPLPVPSCPSETHTEEDVKREELVRDIMGKDKSLAEVLDQSGRRTTMDLMKGLYSAEEGVLEGGTQRRKPSSSKAPASPRNTDRKEEDGASMSAAVCLVPSSSYYNTSAPKAELLIKMKDMQEELEQQDSEDELDVDLASKKQELIWSLARKLDVLREARQSLQDDVEENEALGREVEATVQRLCQPNQLDKFRMFVGDLDKVVSLLLSLSGRLARVENALNSLEEDAPNEEKHTLTEKRKLLMRQHEDAKELKENLDRRERLVSVVMETHLDPESLDDYRHFVKMKSALIIEQRKLEDKIKLGEEQLKCLLDSLPLEKRPLL